MNKKHIKLIAKILVTALALYLVFRKIDTHTTWQVIQAAKPGWLLLALVFFIASKLFCSFRLNGYFRDVGLNLSERKNLKLYAIGMFYNLFLPGGIGGDGYKVYLLNKTYKTSVKQLINAVLLDRGNGLAVLVFLMFTIMLFLEVNWNLPVDIVWIGLLGMVLVPPGLYLIMILFFKNFIGSILSTTGYSFLNQILQLFSAYLILVSMGVGYQVVPYIFIFLVSSMVSILPLTIGGVGARELVFVLAHEYVGIDKNVAVAFSLVFFVITVITSLSGAFMRFKE